MEPSPAAPRPCARRPRSAQYARHAAEASSPGRTRASFQGRPTQALRWTTTGNRTPTIEREPKSLSSSFGVCRLVSAWERLCMSEAWTGLSGCRSESSRVVSAGSVEVSEEDDGSVWLTSGAVAVGPEDSTAACNPLSRPPKVPQGAEPSRCSGLGLFDENDVVPKAFAVQRRPRRLLLARICLRSNLIRTRQRRE